jgi:hypothetical protein
MSDTLKAGEAAMKQLEKMSPEEREAFEKSIDPVKSAKFAEHLRDLATAARNGSLFARPDFSKIESMLENAESPLEIMKEQNELLRKQIEQNRSTTGIACCALLVAGAGVLTSLFFSILSFVFR